MRMKCKYCNKEIDLFGPKFSSHVKWCDDNPKKEIYLTKLEHARNKRKELPASNHYIKAAQEGREIKTSLETREKLSKAGKGRLHDDETKEIISNKRKKWLQENPELHPWKKSRKFISAPCEFFKQKLRSLGIEFEEEYSPIEGRYFSIDIAFPQKKIGIEINGEQHYKRTGELKEYYKKRHELIENAGWTLLELHYSSCYNEEMFGAMVKRISQRSSKP